MLQPDTHFQFRERREKINWRLVAALDIEKIIQRVDIPQLQNLIETITFCDSQELEPVDVTFSKLFKASQLIIEYLLHSQELLVKERNDYQKETLNLKAQIQHLIANHSTMETEAKDLKKEMKTMKKTLYAYQLMAKMPGGIGQASTTAIYYRCEYCPKSFNSQFYLESHLMRRHGEKAVPRKESVNDVQKITESVENFATRIMETERQFRNQIEEKMESKMAQEVAKRQNSLEEAYRQERLLYSKEIQNLKNALHQELAEERAVFNEQKAAIEAFMKNKQSNFGRLEDEEKGEIPASTEASALANLESRVQTSINALRDQMSLTHKAETDALQQKLSTALAELDTIRSALIRERKKSSANLPITVEREVEEKVFITHADSMHHLEEKVKSLEKIKSQASIKSEAKPSLDELWKNVLDKLSRHKQISNPAAPWAKSLFAHDSELTFAHIKNTILNALKDSLVEAGIDEEKAKELWGKDKASQDYFLAVLGEQILEMEKHGMHDPIYGNMKRLLIKELDKVVQLYYRLPVVKEQKPPIPQRSRMGTMDSGHRRALSHEPFDRPKMPSLQVATKPRERSKTLNFANFQDKLSKLTKRKESVMTADSSPASASTISPLSPLKRGSMLDKFQNLFRRKSSFSTKLPEPGKNEFSASLSHLVQQEATHEEVESPASTSEIDYSNPARKVVYQKESNDYETEELDVTSDLSAVTSTVSPTHTSVRETPDISKDIIEEESEQESPETIPKPNELVVFDDSDFDAESDSKSEGKQIPANVAQPIKDSEKSSAAVPGPQANQDSFQKKSIPVKSEDSFDISELSELTDNEPVKETEGNQTKETDDLEALLDKFDTSMDQQTLKRSTAIKKPARYDDEFDIDEFDM